MAQRSSSRADGRKLESRLCGRLSHLLILSLLLSMPLLAGFGEPRHSQAQAPALLGGGLAPEEVGPLQVELPAALPVQQASQQGATSSAPAQAQFTAPRPTTPWVQSFRPTTLWASERPDAASLGGLPQWTHFRRLGEPVGTRIQVEYPGDGVSKLPLRGWIDTPDIGPAGPPTPEYELASGGTVSPSTGVMIPRRIVQAWPQGISAQYAALIDGPSGEILWGRNAHGEVAPASLTKIVTSLVALERARLTDRVTVRVDSRTMYESTVMGLKPGENLSMETLLFGLMLPSGNDAAIAIAQHVAGSEPAFTELMNAKAAELGLVHSRFVNAHGLDAKEHYSSPFDLIQFARFGMRDPTFYRLSSARQHSAEGYDLNNMNRLLSIYPKADGVKVGYTDAAGRAIVASAVQDGRRVYCALIRSSNPTAEAQALLEWAFRGFVWQ